MVEPRDNKVKVSAGPFFDFLASVVQITTGTVLTAMVLLVVSEAALRGFAKVSLGYVEEITGYFVVMLTFFGAALALRSGSLFQVSYLFDRLPFRVRTWLTLFFTGFALIICVVFAWKCHDLVLSSLARGNFAPTVLRTPLWIPQILLPSGFAVIGIFLVEQALLSLHNLKAKK